MRLAAFLPPDGNPQCGSVSGEEIVSLAGAGFSDLLSLIRAGEPALTRAGAWVTDPASGPRFKLSSVKLLTPIPRPPKLLCIGLNYRDHAAETGAAVPKIPTVFAKFPTAIIGPDDNIILPKSSGQPDYEAEFAFVIGKGGRHIPAERWAEHVFGYTMMNDVSARDLQKAVSQWTMGKNFDTFAPMGPYIVTRDEIADPHALDISLTLSGELMQSSNTRNLVFGVPELIAFLSSVFTLEAGDVVSTGTPAGVGFVRKPPRYLQPGDETVVRVQGLGELRNPVVAE